MDVVPEDLVDKGLYIGVWLACQVLSTVLLGILTVQCSVYFHRYKNDQWWLKSLVSIVWVVDLFNHMVSVFASYHVTIQNFGPVFVFPPPWTTVVMGLLGMFNVALVQLFYARRGYLLNKSLWPFSLICVVGTLLSLGLGLLKTVELATKSELPDKWLKEFWYLGVIATDIMVTVVVVYALKLTAREYGFSGGLRGLVLYTIANGMLTIVVTMTAIILFELLPNSWAYSAVSMILARIHVISLLTSLNLRGTWIKETTNSSIESSAPPRRRRVSAARTRLRMSILTLRDPEDVPIADIQNPIEIMGSDLSENDPGGHTDSLVFLGELDDSSRLSGDISRSSTPQRPICFAIHMGSDFA